jgi:hypothetical protein
MLSQGHEFTATVAEKLLSYALGRSVAYYDQPALRELLRNAERDHYRWSSLILGIVNSTPFQMRRVQDSAPVAPPRTTVAHGQ